MLEFLLLFATRKFHFLTIDEIILSRLHDASFFSFNLFSQNNSLKIFRVIELCVE